MKLIDISTRRYPNTFAMVDDEDFDWLDRWKWSLSSKGYVVRCEYSAGRQRNIFMHKEILKPPKGMLGDHRFGNKLDNRRENLRICTNAENARNRKPYKGRNLPKGVDWHTKQKRFRARIEVNGRNIHLGYFLTASESETAYIEASKKYHGEFRFQD